MGASASECDTIPGQSCHSLDGADGGAFFFGGGRPKKRPFSHCCDLLAVLFLGGGKAPTKIDYRKRGTLVRTFLLEDLVFKVVQFWTGIGIWDPSRRELLTSCELKGKMVSFRQTGGWGYCFVAYIYIYHTRIFKHTCG